MKHIRRWIALKKIKQRCGKEASGLLESIYENPEGWEKDGPCLKYKDGTEIWICNRRNGCKLVGTPGFNQYEKRMAWKAYRWWCLYSSNCAAHRWWEYPFVAGAALLLLIIWPYVKRRSVAVEYEKAPEGASQKISHPE